MSHRGLILWLSVVLILLVSSGLPAAAEERPFGGVGLNVVPTVTGELVVLQVVKSSPAAEQGLLPGDLIYQVGDFPLKDSDFGKVISEHLWGPIGSAVKLSYLRPGVAGTHKVVLQRSALDPHLTVTPSAQAAPAAVK